MILNPRWQLKTPIPLLFFNTSHACRGGLLLLAPSLPKLGGEVPVRSDIGARAGVKKPDRLANEREPRLPFKGAAYSFACDPYRSRRPWTAVDTCL